MSQSDEVAHRDVSVQPLTSDEDGGVKVAAAGEATVQQVNDEASQEEVESSNLPSSVFDIEPQVPCDAVETVQSEMESESHKNDAKVEEQADSEEVCDKIVTTEEGDGASHHGLEETETSFIIEKSESEDTAAVGSEDGLDSVGTMNSEPSEKEGPLEGRLVDLTLPSDSDVTVNNDLMQSTDVVDNSAGSDVQLNDQITEVAAESEQLRDGKDAADDICDPSALPDDVVGVNTEVENVVAHTDDGSSALVDNVPVEPSCTLAPSDDIRTASTADTTSDITATTSDITATSAADITGDISTTSAVDITSCIVSTSAADITGDATATNDADITDSNAVNESVPLQPAEPHMTADLAEVDRPADGLPECQWKEADKLVEVCQGMRGEDIVLTDSDTPADGVDNETAAQLVCSGTIEDAGVISVTSNAEPVAESDNRRSDFVSSVAEPAVQSEHDTDIAEPSCDGVVHAADVSAAGGDAVVESNDRPSISVDRTIDEVKNDVQDSGQEELSTEMGDGDMCDGGDWLDTVVNVSNMSFVNVQDDVGADVSTEQRTDVVAVAPGGDEAASVETSVERVAVVNADISNTGNEIAMVGVGSDVSFATTVETSLEGVAVVDADSSTEQNGIVEANSQKSAVVVDEKNVVDSASDSGIDTAVCGSGEPAQQPQTVVDGKAEKSRLYAKNVKPDMPASLVKDTGKTGTAPQQDMKVTGDQPSNVEAVVMRSKKAQLEPSSASDKENAASTVQRVRTDFLLLSNLIQFEFFRVV